MAVIQNSLYTNRWTSGTDNYAYAALTHTITPTSYRKATITWQVSLRTSYSYIVVGELSVKVNGTEIYYRSPDDAKSATNHEILASGTYDVEENPVTLYIGAGIYEHEINCFNTVTVEYTNESVGLNTLKVPTPVTVGDEYNIINYTTPTLDMPTGKTPGTCSTIRFTIGEMEGVIAQYSEDMVLKWTVPLELFTMYPTKTSMGGTVYCETYRMDMDVTPDGRYVYLGTIAYPITVEFKEGPKLDPEVRDINPITLALTGSQYKFVRFFSNAEFAFNATPGPGTYLTYYKVENDPYVWEQRNTEMETGPDLVLNKVESGTFKFTVRDARNYTATKTVEEELIPYVKLTCNIWRIEATGDGTIKVGIGGDIFSQSFGRVRNTLKISYRVKEGNGEFGEWQSIDYLNEDETYEVTVTLEGLDYRKTYTFEAMAEDKLMTVVSKQLPVRAIPVYDWGRDDFNVNVNFNMNHQTILRHNHNANNLVVSSSGGFIYFRPKGTDDTSAEVKISPQGNIELTGDIIINGQSLKSLLKI